MGNIVFNVGKGRVAALAQNVEDNSPSGCLLRVIPWNSSDTDTDVKRADNVAAVEALSSTAECTGSNWSRKSINAAALTIQVDDTNDWCDVDIDDQTWTAVAASNDSTDLMVAYDASGSDADAVLRPLTWHDFVVTTDGSDVTAVINSEGFYRAS